MLYVDGYAETVVISTFDNCGILDKGSKFYTTIQLRQQRWEKT